MVLKLPYFAESPYPVPVASKVDFAPTPSKGPRCKRRAGSPEESQPAPANKSIRQQRNPAQERINPRRPQSVTDLFLYWSYTNIDIAASTGTWRQDGRL